MHLKTSNVYFTKLHISITARYIAEPFRNLVYPISWFFPWIVPYLLSKWKIVVIISFQHQFITMNIHEFFQTEIQRISHGPPAVPSGCPRGPRFTLGPPQEDVMYCSQSSHRLPKTNLKGAAVFIRFAFASTREKSRKTESKSETGERGRACVLKCFTHASCCDSSRWKHFKFIYRSVWFNLSTKSDPNFLACLEENWFKLCLGSRTI